MNIAIKSTLLIAAATLMLAGITMAHAQSTGSRNSQPQTSAQGAKKGGAQKGEAKKPGTRKARSNRGHSGRSVKKNSGSKPKNSAKGPSKSSQNKHAALVADKGKEKLQTTAVSGAPASRKRRTTKKREVGFKEVKNGVPGAAKKTSPRSGKRRTKGGSRKRRPTASSRAAKDKAVKSGAGNKLVAANSQDLKAGAKHQPPPPVSPPPPVPQLTDGAKSMEGARLAGSNAAALDKAANAAREKRNKPLTPAQQALRDGTAPTGAGIINPRNPAELAAAAAVTQKRRNRPLAVIKRGYAKLRGYLRESE